MDQIAPEFTVGITGHRWNKIPNSEGARIAEQLASVFSIINVAVQDTLTTHHVAQPPSLRLVSGLAEGADQIAVWSRPKGWALDAILPFPRARYLHDFAPARATGGVDRRQEFKAALAQARLVVEFPETGDVVCGYKRVGEWLLSASNLLVAVWDGEKAAGPGGTAMVVSQAIAQGLPVVWICSRQDRLPTLVSDISEADHRSDAETSNASFIAKVIQSMVGSLVVASPSEFAELRKT